MDKKVVLNLDQIEIPAKDAAGLPKLDGQGFYLTETGYRIYSLKNTVDYRVGQVLKLTQVHDLIHNSQIEIFIRPVKE